MRLLKISLATHLAAGIIGGFCIFSSLSIVNGSVGGSLAIFVVGLGLVAGVAMLFCRRFQDGIQQMERAVASGKDTHIQKTNILEFDQATERLRKYVQRWSNAAERTRDQNREISWIVDTMDARSTDQSTKGTDVGTRLKQILFGMASTTNRNVKQIETLVEELQSTLQEHSSTLEEQSDSVSKTTTYVEQLSINIASVSQNINTAESDSQSLSESARDARAQIKTLATGIRRIQSRVESCESRLRKLVDHFREIGSIAETITEISSRTDMLALNVSIESVRAGQNARGFAVVAEEVRKLAEQASQAAREVTGLVESIQLETQESINGIAEQRTSLGDEIDRVDSVRETVTALCQSSGDTRKQLEDISRATGQQINLTQDLIGAVEKISTSSRQGRRKIESSSWGIGSLVGTTKELNQVFELLWRTFRGQQPSSDDSDAPDQIAHEATDWSSTSEDANDAVAVH